MEKLKHRKSEETREDTRKIEEIIEYRIKNPPDGGL